MRNAVRDHPAAPWHLVDVLRECAEGEVRGAATIAETCRSRKFLGTSARFSPRASECGAGPGCAVCGLVGFKTDFSRRR